MGTGSGGGQLERMDQGDDAGLAQLSLILTADMALCTHKSPY